jgi:benzoyl-CoA reductase/2-hydroxyglutaryl-CoA dehydratase subunit BcrC/BadD/HgdB
VTRPAKMIIYSCPYIPAEWIASHGLKPSRIIPDAAGSDCSLIPVEGVCPYVRAFISKVINEESACGVIVTTVCDQMRRAFDIIKCREASPSGLRSKLPVFLMNVPNTWQSVASQKLYLDELKRLGRFLVQLGGKSPSNEELAKVMLEYDTARANIRAARGYISSRQYSETIAEFFCNSTNQKFEIRKSKIEYPTDDIPLAIIGGPLLKQDFQIFDCIENSGGRVVLDATETGERGICAPFDSRRLRDEPLMELADAYFDGIQDVSRRPNSELYKWLGRELKDREVRGIIFRRYVWCDLWHAEFGRLKDWIKLPVLDIDVAGDDDADRHREANRIRAFLETLG